MNAKFKRVLITSVVVIILAVLLVISGIVGEDMYGSLWSLVPPVVAILLALYTKEVYSSLFVGILIGTIFASQGSLENVLNGVFFSDGGIVTVLSDSYNMGIIVFLVMLGIMIILMNKAGGSAAFGRWASTHVHSKAGAQIATVILGVLIFVDDYFNCLTVGSVMRPVTDKEKLSRAKLAYIIDATAAPVCIIAPVSSWAAAVTSYVPEELNLDGFQIFLKTIPFNLYAILTLVMIFSLALMRFDFGPMAKFEKNADNGDLFTTPDRPYGDDIQDNADIPASSSLWDLLAPVLVLIAACVICLSYSGGWLQGDASFSAAFQDADASVGLVLGGFVALIFTLVYYGLRGTMNPKEYFSCFAEGFKAMVPAILILCFAWSLSTTTKVCLGSTDYVKAILANAGDLARFIPCILFLLACFIAFSTGTSWGTFGIMIPIICNVFPGDSTLLPFAIAAAMGGAVMGDHCSPISDTTIMASAGAHCNHVDHVSTQLPYASFVAAICFLCYVVGAFLPENLLWLVTPLGIAVLLLALSFLRRHRAS